MIKCIYFLDNSAIITIKGYNEGKDLSRLKDRIDELKSLDKNENLISGLLASIEGLSGEQETSFKKSLSMECMAIELKKFFKNAQVDSNALLKIKDQMDFGNLGSHEYSFKNCSKFREELFNLLHKKPKKELIKQVKFEIDKIANKYGLKNSLLYIITISALYGLEYSRDVLKLNKERDECKTYNSMGDVYSITRFSQLVNQISPHMHADMRFLTFDEGLRFLSEQLFCQSTVVTHNSLYGGIKYEHKVEIPKKLFPDMSEEDYSKFCSEIGAIIPSPSTLVT